MPSGKRKRRDGKTSGNRRKINSVYRAESARRDREEENSDENK